MRVHLPLIALLLPTLALSTGAAPPGDSEELRPPPSRTQNGQEQQAVCRDQVHAVRAERGLPNLQRESARSDEPLLIAAVDRRVSGCSAMVMRHDTSDIRPLPAPDGQPLLRLLPGQ